jgi:hypothetical protein
MCRGATLPQFSTIGGYVGIACTLFGSGADPNVHGATFEGRTALESAAEHGRINIVQLLLGSETLIAGPGKEQFDRAISLAQVQGHGAVVNLLETHHAHWESIAVLTLCMLRLESRNGL